MIGASRLLGFDEGKRLWFGKVPVFPCFACCCGGIQAGHELCDQNFSVRFYPSEAQSCRKAASLLPARHG